MGTDLIEGNTEQIIAQILTRLKALESRDIQTGNLAEISSDMGDIDAGRFIASSSGTGEPTDPNFSGSFMSAEGETFDGELWNIGGVNGGELQFGLSAETGKAYFAGGAAIIDRTGFTMTGLNYSVLQTADNGTTDPNPRYGWLEMFLLSGQSIPAWGLTYSDSTGSPITNGDFETGDLTGWTDSGTDFSVVEESEGSGTYVLECADITAGTATLTSDRFACSAGLPYFFRFRTNEYRYTSGTDTIYLEAATYIEETGPDTNKSGLPTIMVGESNEAANDKNRGLVNFDLTPYYIFAKASSAIFNLYHLYEMASNTRTMRIYRMLQEWTEDGATWNTYNGSDAWGTAGAANTTTDREASDIGSVSLSSTEAAGWKQITLNLAEFQEWLDGTLDNYGIQLKMDTETNDKHVFTKENIQTRPYLSLTYTTPSDYTISVNFYDDPAAGSLISSVELCTEYNAAGWRQINKQVVPPAGAVSAEIVIESGVGLGFYVDDITMLFTRALYCTDDGWDSSQGLFPTRASWFWNEVKTSVTMVSAQYSGQDFYTYWGPSAANANNGDAYTLSGLLKTGTSYTMYILGVTTSGSGKLDITMDGVSITTGQDWYSASTTYNVIKSFTFDVTYNGYHKFVFTVNGKHASSSDYRILLTRVWIVPSAD